VRPCASPWTPGFFYVENHGIDQRVVDGMLGAAERFFSQPLKAKAALDAAASPLWRGYISTASGFHTCKPGTAAGLDRKESFTVGAEGEGVSPMHGANQWPAELPGWEGTVREYWQAQLTLSRVIARGQ
jgi:isopenicillin N synthase-like dioxygenase